MMSSILRILQAIFCSTALVGGFVPPARNAVRPRSQTSLFGQTPPSATDDNAHLTTALEIDRRAALVQATAVASASLLPTTSTSAAGLSLTPLEVKLVELENEYAEKKNSNGDPSKHTPKVSLSRKEIEVQVPHVMDREKPHYIQYLWLKDVSKSERPSTGKIVAIKSFSATDPSPPTISAGIASGQLPSATKPITQGMVIKPILFCNLHGLWEGEAVEIRTV